MLHPPPLFDRMDVTRARRVLGLVMRGGHRRVGLAMPSCRALVLLAALSALLCCTATPQFTDGAGRVIPGSIARMEDLTIGGIPQRVWLRGLSQDSPILVLLHGGPGASESPLFRYFDSALEQKFLVVYWEQRGTGRSYRADIPPETMTIDSFVGDLDDLIDQLRKRFGARKVALMGHSWGTVVGTIYASRYPDKVSVYVGIGQIADMREGELTSYRFALSEARQRDDRDAIEELTRTGPPPHAVDAMLVSRKWVERFGGAFAGDLSTGKLLWYALRTDEVNLWDLVKFGQGNRFSLIHLWPELREVSLSGRFTAFRMPIVFMLGRGDQEIPSSVAADYFDRVGAPAKKLIWFDRSAHNPPFEEPERFVEAVIGEVLPFAKGP